MNKAEHEPTDASWKIQTIIMKKKAFSREFTLLSQNEAE